MRLMSSRKSAANLVHVVTTVFLTLVIEQNLARITEILAQRYGKHEGIYAWQTDNEYGCHNTVFSYSPAAESAFRQWLTRINMETIDNLNDCLEKCVLEYGI